ncbi:MAG: M24 family metallopeptidase, partial [Dehalococcoidia bacterium]|nr:M24 family metallopeptidase [Dehalococcoidia bacterium]
IARRALGLPAEGGARRWYYLLPRDGDPIKLVSAVEPTALDRLPGEKRVYRTWQEREAALRAMLATQTTLAMEYSPGNAIPYVAAVDAGTVELIRSFGVTVGSSADLVQQAVAVWTAAQRQTHLAAATRLMALKDAAFAELRRALRAGETITDYQLQQFMAEWLRSAGLVFDHDPEVATNANASDPHFAPSPERQTPIREGDALLLDFWAKLDDPDAVYADYTWMAYVGRDVPSALANVFAVVTRARDAAIAFVQEAARAKRRVRGCEVDDVARAVVAAAGYGDYFVHRTGHNIGRDVHGEGANLDNYETRDERALLPGTCCSIEPGIYLPDYGFRSEVNVLFDDDDAIVTGDIQTALIPLLA